MKELFNHLELERLADETAAQAFGVGFNNLDCFITEQCESREGDKAITALDVILRRLFQHRNRLLRVELLPDGILLNIFKLAIDFDWFTDITKNTALCHDLLLHYRSLYSIQRVNKRWHDVIVSYAPFWSLISTTMPKNVIEVALTRAKESTLCIRAKYDEEENLRHFMDGVLPLSSRIGSLIIDLEGGGDQVLAPLWTHIPAVQNLQIIQAGDIPYKRLHETASTPRIPSPRWIHLFRSAVPTLPTLYAQLEELIIEDPREPLTPGVLKSIISSAPRLRILRLEELLDEGSDTESRVEPLPMPNLQLLHIHGCSSHKVGSILDCFQLPPSINIQISPWGSDVTPYESHIRSQIWAALHSMTESSFCLELGPSTYKFQTRNTLIEIDVGERPHRQWPDLFKDFVPRAGQAPIRVYIFLKAGLDIPGELPHEGCIAGLQSDSFVMM